MRSCSSRYFCVMLSWVAESKDGYLALSKSSSSCVRRSSTDIFAAGVVSSSSTDEMLELEEALPVLFAARLRIEEDGWSTGSKIGLWSADEAELVVSCSEAEHESKYSSPESMSSSSCVLNLPPCIGGRKFVHRPSMRPIW
jgi:hypothetical protein